MVEKMIIGQGKNKIAAKDAACREWLDRNGYMIPQLSDEETALLDEDEVYTP